MKKILLSFTVLLAVSFLFQRCAKEYSVEGGAATRAEATFSKDAADMCTPAVVTGKFIVDNILNGDSSYVVIQMNVTKIGSFTVSSDTVNGYYFSASGYWGATGGQTVKLKSVGKPILPGADIFTVYYDSSFCDFTVNVTSTGGGGGGTTAVYTLNGAPGNCTNANVQGTYTAGTALAAANKVTVEVNVTTIGTYTMSTSLNGMTFAATGTFTSTGINTVILQGTGTPTTAGVNNIPLTAGGTTCSFAVTVSGTSVANNHFPLTANSWWSYDNTDPTFTGDSLKRVNSFAQNILGTNYRGFQEMANVTPFDSSYYRFNSNNYYEYTEITKYSAIEFDIPQFAELNFLKENASTGTTWNSQEFTGTILGFPAKIQYFFTLTNNNASTTVNGVTYTNCYEVDWKSRVSIAGSPYSDNITFKYFYANNIGLVSMSLLIVGQPTPIELKIRKYQVF